MQAKTEELLNSKSQHDLLKTELEMMQMRLKQVILSVSDDIDESDLVDQVEGVVEAMREEIVARDEEVEKAQEVNLDAKKVELEQTIEVLRSENEGL